jgi:prevent-host-death family protein
MKPIQVSEDILAIADFKARASEVVRRLREHRRPVVITQGGKPAAVLLAPEEFDQLVHQSRFVAAIDEGLADVEAGRVLSDAELDAALDEKLGKRKGVSPKLPRDVPEEEG